MSPEFIKILKFAPILSALLGVVAALIAKSVGKNWKSSLRFGLGEGIKAFGTFMLWYALINLVSLLWRQAWL